MTATGMPRKTMVSAMLAIVLGMSGQACSKGSLSDGPGVGGAGGTGAGGTAGGGDLHLDCVSSLFALCPLQGACASAMRDAGEVTDVCFASGGHVVVTNHGTPQPAAAS